MLCSVPLTVPRVVEIQVVKFMEENSFFLCLVLWCLILEELQMVTIGIGAHSSLISIINPVVLLLDDFDATFLKLVGHEMLTCT